MKTPIDGNWSDWTEACKLLESEIPVHSFTTWIQPLLPVAIEDNRLSFQVTSSFVRSFLENRYVSILSNALRQVTGHTWEIEFLLEKEVETLLSEIAAQKSSAAPANAASSNNSMQMLMLNPKNTCDTFVIGNHHDNAS